MRGHGGSKLSHGGASIAAVGRVDWNDDGERRVLYVLGLHSAPIVVRLVRSSLCVVFHAGRW